MWFCLKNSQKTHYSTRRNAPGRQRLAVEKIQKNEGGLKCAARPIIIGARLQQRPTTTIQHARPRGAHRRFIMSNIGSPVRRFTVIPAPTTEPAVAPPARPIEPMRKSPERVPEPERAPEKVG